MMNRAILLTIIAIVMTVVPAASQVRLGVRAGITLGKLRFDRNVVDSDNRVGFNGGLLLDVGIPVVGLGIEASAMYSRRNNRLSDGDRVFKRHYLEFPVYARYRLELPSIRRVFTPYIYTGPTFSVLFDDNSGSRFSDNKTYLSWDVGAGADLFNHVRLSLTFGLGMTKAMEYVDKTYDGGQVNGKDRHWTLSAAYLF